MRDYLSITKNMIRATCNFTTSNRTQIQLYISGYCI